MAISEDDDFSINLSSDNSEDLSGDDRRKSKKNKRKKNKEKYCICRRSHTDEFMIMCDECKEWFHGSCVNITQRQAKQINNYYCDLCQAIKESINNNIKNPIENPNQFVDSENNFPNENSIKRIDDDYSPDDEEDEDEFRLPTEKKVKRRYRKNPSKIKPRKNEKSQGKKRGRKKGQSNKAKENRNRGRKKSADKKSSHGRSKVYSEESDDETKNNTPRQCFGPGCIHVARKESKYCSDKCGLNLAEKRMMLILPERIKIWQQIPTIADERSRKEIDEIDKEVIKTNNAINEIEVQKSELLQMMQEAKNSIPYSEEEHITILEKEGDNSFYCPTCASEPNEKQVIRHIDRCANKIEAQSSFGSCFKAKNEKRLLCETFIPNNSTYCKRLRINCPEHIKEPKISDTEVCGCPLRTEESPFEDVPHSFCRLLRKRCNTHYGWEKQRQAVLDAEMLQQYFKMDELLQRRKKVRKSLNSRGGLLGLLLHKTSYEIPVSEL